MNDYSPNTRVELTPKGWLFIAKSALQASEKGSDPKRSAELRRRAKDSIVRALKAVDEKIDGVHSLPTGAETSTL
jgi:hypothetical protein